MEGNLLETFAYSIGVLLDNVRMVVRRMDCDYVSPMHQELSIKVFVQSKGL